MVAGWGYGHTTLLSAHGLYYYNICEGDLWRKLLVRLAPNDSRPKESSSL